jgi:ribosomal-protein-alanine N-acetyltransferase
MTDMPMFPTFPQLQTLRQTLRQITPDDAQAVFAIFSDAEVTRYHDSPTYATLEEAQGWIERRRLAYESGRAIRWGLARKRG